MNTPRQKVIEDRVQWFRILLEQELPADIATYSDALQDREVRKVMRKRLAHASTLRDRLGWPWE